MPNGVYLTRCPSCTNARTLILSCHSATTCAIASASALVTSAPMVARTEAATAARSAASRSTRRGEDAAHRTDRDAPGQQAATDAHDTIQHRELADDERCDGSERRRVRGNMSRPAEGSGTTELTQADAEVKQRSYCEFNVQY